MLRSPSLLDVLVRVAVRINHNRPASHVLLSRSHGLPTVVIKQFPGLLQRFTTVPVSPLLHGQKDRRGPVTSLQTDVIRSSELPAL